MRIAAHAQRPRMWEIERTAAGDVVHFGRNRFALADVARVSGEEVRDRYTDGLLLGAVVFLAAACAISFGVFDGGLRSRYLLGTVFLAFLGIAGISELAKLNRQSYYEVKIALVTGETLTFTSADRADVEAFMARIAPSR